MTDDDASSPAQPADSAPETLIWPLNFTEVTPDFLAAGCASCGRSWRIHPDVGGYRFRCRCNAWVDVPAAPVQASPVAFLPLSKDAEAAPLGRPIKDLATLPDRRLAGMTSWDGKPLRPDTAGNWSLRHASVEDRQRWTTRTILEIVAMWLAFIAPAMFLQFSLTGPDRALYMPLSAVASSILVLLVGFLHPAFTFAGLRPAHPKFFGESFVVCAGFAATAIVWTEFLRQFIQGGEDEFAGLAEHVGLPMTLIVVAVVPGIFEEIAFRGLIQARLDILMGKTIGTLVAGATFALAHGVTPGLPFHMGIGVYLAFLRRRSQSLLPGMMLHALYNGSIVLWANRALFSNG